jgi:sulfoxide reductase heme-binding subunit YedZ
LTSQLLWFTARSSGLVAWALVSLSVLWGLALSTRVLGSRPRANWLLDLHRFLGAASVVFVAVHVLAILLDSYVHFGLVEILVPLASSWRPLPVALGIVAAYLLIAVEITSLLRRRLPRRAWHAVHLASYPLFAFSTLHLVTAGTDRANPVLRILVVAVTGTISFLTFLRVDHGSRQGREVGATTKPLPSAV